MKLLWVTNQATPTIAKAQESSIPISGGWMEILSQQLSNIEGIELYIVFPYYNYNGISVSGQVNGIHYSSVNIDKSKLNYKDSDVQIVSELVKAINPDMVHIWGTEYIHTLITVKACEELGMIDRTVISIQGIVSVIARHYMGYIEHHKMHNSLHDILKRDTIKNKIRILQIRGIHEIEAITKVKHVIGRTDWDEACTNQINEKVKYHHCNETLRQSFYEHKWSLDKCQHYSVFISQAHYPLKGYHIALEAINIVRRRYPEVQLITTGKDKLDKGYRQKLRKSSYDCYISKYIHKHGLEGHVRFTGWLDEEAMCQQFLDSHVFVSASSVENSPNVVGEAMLLGVPTIASDVGGVKNMLTHKVDGFTYPADEPYMLAHYIIKIFENKNLALDFSDKSKEHAAKTHDQIENIKHLLDIYTKISFS